MFLAKRCQVSLIVKDIISSYIWDNSSISCIVHSHNCKAPKSSKCPVEVRPIPLLEFFVRSNCWRWQSLVLIVSVKIIIEVIGAESSTGICREMLLVCPWRIMNWLKFNDSCRRALMADSSRRRHSQISVSKSAGESKKEDVEPKS